MLLLYRGDAFDANFFYHSGVDIDHCFLLCDGKKKTLLVNRMNASIAKETFGGKVVVFDDATKALSTRLRKKRVFIDGASVSARMADHLKRFCKLKDHTEELLRMRAVKRDDEAGDIRKAVKHTKDILDSLDFKKAKTEADVRKQLLKETFDRGLELAFDPIVATDRNTSFPHYLDGNKKLGSLVLVDFGVRYSHYCSDLTRCFILDNDRKKKEEYQKLQDICYFLADALPGLDKGKDVAKLAEELIEKAGFPKLIHAIGHGVGLDVHEYPRLGVKSADPLKGACLAIEPAFYLSKYGMRFEETIWFDGKRARVL